MSKEPILSSSVSRARRYRRRQRDGEVVVQVEVPAHVITGFASYGLLDADNVTRDEISFALEILLDAVSKGGITLEKSWIASFEDG